MQKICVWLLATAAAVAVPARAKCPPAETVTIGKFGVHQDGVAGLPADQRAALKALAGRIANSFDKGCTPVSSVDLVGHADRDPARGTQFELDISKKRAAALRDALAKDIGAAKARSIGFKVDGVGATQLKIKNARSESQRKENRRVVIATKLRGGANRCVPRPRTPGRSALKDSASGDECVQPPSPVPGLSSFFALPQSWNGETGRFWIPKGTGSDKTLPLVIYLHGLVRGAQKASDDKIPQNQMMATKAEMEQDVNIGWNFGMNMGKLSELLLQKKLVKEHIVAAPAEKVSKRASGKTLWDDFPLGTYVQELSASLAAMNGPKIDFDRVLVAGWSGAGCNKHNGLLRIADGGGRFSDGQKDRAVMVLGFADTGVNPDVADDVVKGLAGAKPAANSSTAVYSLHELLGGCARTDPKTNAKRDETNTYVARLSATKAHFDGKGKAKGPFGARLEETESSAFDLHNDDGASPPKRIAARIKVTKDGLRRHVAELVTAEALFEGKTQRDPHGLVPLAWGFYALPRFLP
jgi:hypothetical protein